MRLMYNSGTVPRVSHFSIFFFGKKGCQSDLTSHKSLPKEISRCWMSCLTSERKACSDMRICLPASSDYSRFSCDETPSQNVTPKSVTPRHFQYLYWNFPPWSIQNVPPHQRKCREVPWSMQPLEAMTDEKRMDRPCCVFSAAWKRRWTSMCWNTMQHQKVLSSLKGLRLSKTSKTVE